MRSTITALLFCASMWAAPTTIVGTYSLVGGAPATGAAYITWGRFTTSDGRVIPGGTLSVPIRSGHLSTSLEPNDTALPTGTVYTVTYSFRQGTGETWVVPTSGSPVDVTAIATTVPLPPPDTIFALTQIAGGGATPGQYLTWDGTYWHPGNGPNPGGSNNQVQYKLNSTTFAGFTMSGYCTLVVSTGVVSCRGPDVGTAGIPISDGSAWTAATNAQITAKVNVFTSSLPGSVPAAGGTSAALCLNQQGTWTTCGGGGGGGGTNPTSVGLQYWQTGSSTWRAALNTDLTTLLGFTPLNAATLGQPSGPAQLDSGGFLTSAVLPSIGSGGTCALSPSQSCGLSYDTKGRISGTIQNNILIDETGLSLGDVTTMNASTARHGFLRKLNGNAASYVDGTGGLSVPVGSVTTNTSSSIVGEIPLFADTGGKFFKRSTLTGVLVSTSGVASVVAGTGTYCVHVDGTSAACGSGGGTSLTSGLTDWAPTRTSATVVTFGSSCVPGAECKVKIGQRIVALAGGPYTCTLANSHTGDLQAYINSDTNAVTCATATALNGDVTPSASAVVVGSVAAMCSDCGQLFTWHVTAGALDTNPTAVYAAYMSWQPTPIAGFNVQITPGDRPIIAAAGTNNAVTASASSLTLDMGAGALQTVTLTASVSTVTLSNLQVGFYSMSICHDATGTRTWAWPANVFGGGTIGTVANKCNTQLFRSDGTNMYDAGGGMHADL